MNYRPFSETEIIFSSKQKLADRVIDLDFKNIVLVMSERAVARWEMGLFIKDIRSHCKLKGGSFSWISFISPNPTQVDVIESLKLIGEQTFEAVVAIGGGSALDLAKAICAFRSEGKKTVYSIKEITDCIVNRKYQKDGVVDIIAVPTTAGTGSELAQWATIWDENKACKFSIDDQALKPKMAIIVPELTLTVPPLMTLATGLDAMCQAVEAYWSKRTSPIVQEIAYRAVQLLINNLRNAVVNPSNITSRDKLCRASVLAGLAFSQTKTTACHSISYPLTMLYNVPHGLAASITLDAVGHINRGHFPLDEDLFALFDHYGGIINWIDSVCEGVVRMRLSAFGITEKDFRIIVDNAFTSGRMDNNPVALSRDDVSKILYSIL